MDVAVVWPQLATKSHAVDLAPSPSPGEMGGIAACLWLATKEPRAHSIAPPPTLVGRRRGKKGKNSWVGTRAVQ